MSTPQKKRIGYRGYVTSRGFGEFRIPVPLQSLALRDYCARNGMTFVLPVNETILLSTPRAKSNAFRKWHESPR